MPLIFVVIENLIPVIIAFLLFDNATSKSETLLFCLLIYIYLGLKDRHSMRMELISIKIKKDVAHILKILNDKGREFEADYQDLERAVDVFESYVKWRNIPKLFDMFLFVAVSYNLISALR